MKELILGNAKKAIMKKYVMFLGILGVFFVISYIVCFCFIRPYELKVKEAAEIINNMPSVDLTKLTVETDRRIEKATKFDFSPYDKDEYLSLANSILRYDGIEINNYGELKRALGNNYVEYDMGFYYFDKTNSAVIDIYDIGSWELRVTNMNFPVEIEHRSLGDVLIYFFELYMDPLGIRRAKANIEDEVALIRFVRLATPATGALSITLLLFPLVMRTIWNNKIVKKIALYFYSFLFILKVVAILICMTA